MNDAPLGLEGRGIVKRFGGVTAVAGVDVALSAGELVGLVGPNGAGKTTLFDCLSGRQRPDEGQVVLGGRDVTDVRPAERAALGLGRTFQRLEVFATMTVEEHVVAALEHAGERRDGPWWRRWWGRSDEVRHETERLLERFRLTDVATQRAGELPTGVLRRVELARAAATGAPLLLLDEPASGLDPSDVEGFGALLRGLADEGRGMLVVEHDIRFVVDLVDRLVVLHRGRVLASGDPDDVVADDRVRSAYLGEDVHADAGEGAAP